MFDEPETAAVTPNAELFAGRFDVQRQLKSGNGVETLLAVDVLSGTVVVLKVIDLAAVQLAARMRFDHETRVLRELSGVGLCRLYEAGQSGDRLFLAQPFLPGQTLEQILRAGPLSVAATLRVGIDVASGLEMAHGAGICHRDVKPANIIVDGNDPIRAITLIDFGFARSPSLDTPVRDDLVGTVRYLAPESAGLMAVPADERSDLYAVGVVLFECLTGRPLFPGATVGEMLRQHLSMAVPDLRTLGVTVPRSVEELVRRLLRKDPAERYQSAAGLAADLSELLRAIEAGESDPPLAIGRHDQRSSLTDPSFVGRYAEAELLMTLVGGLSADSTGLVLLEADSGGGKSRVLTEIAQRATEGGAMVMRGQGIAHAGNRPFAILDGVAQDIVERIEHDAAACQSLNVDLNDVAPAVVRALPALNGILAVSDHQNTGPEEFGEMRSIVGLRRLLGWVASRYRPVVLLLDDCQWADALTVRLLAELFSGGDAPSHLGVIAAFRSEEVPADHPLRAIAGSQPLTLGPLSADSMTQLAESMAGPLPVQVLDVVVRLADGNPFIGAAVLRGLVESGALHATSDGWRVEDAKLQDVQAARRSAAFLVQRLELLSAPALSLLSAGAVLGKHFDIAAAVAITYEDIQTAEVIADARRRRLIWIDERTGRCSFFHDKIREALLARLTDEQRAQLHARAADVLLGQPGVEDSELLFDLAYHLDAGGRTAEALPYALAAAERARSRYALDVAVAHYRMARRAVANADRDTRVGIVEGLGDVLALQGRYGEAGRCLSEARSIVRDQSHGAALDGKLGALAFKQGDISKAKRHLEGALTLLGRRIPRRQPIVLTFLAWELLVQLTHSMFPRLTTGHRSTERREDDFLAMRLYSRLAYVYWFHSGKIACAWVHLRGLNLAERYPPSAELGQACSEHAPVMTMLPWYRRGVAYAQRSLEIRRGLEDVWGEGQSYGFTGVVHYAASDFKKSSAACLEAIRLLDQTGDKWEVNTARWNLALCELRTGELTSAADIAHRVFLSASSIGDKAAAGIALSVWTRAVDGRIAGALIAEQLATAGGDAQTTAELHLAAALSSRNDGDLQAASAGLRAAMATVKRAGLRQEYIAPIYPWFATVQRQILQTSPQHNPKLRRARLRECKRAVRAARWWSAPYRNNAPHTLREAGLLASLRGHPRRARRLLGRSVQLAEHQGAAYEAALSRLASAEIANAHGQSEGPLNQARAAVLGFAVVEQAPDSIEPIPTISLFDRFASLLKVGHTIAAATTHPALEAAIRESALTLLRAERCHLIPVGAFLHEPLTTQSGEILDGVSHQLVTSAIDAGKAIAAQNELVDLNESLLLSGIRSAIAAPIILQGKAITCLYATHSQIGELFGEEDLQLADFIATLGGAAFEHLAGSETRFRSLAQNSSDVITLLDRAGVV
ncbi:MAG: AAA family ATPase, partial [Jatrophihabitantaceae bacterium]